MFYPRPVFANRNQLIAFVVGCVLMIGFAAILTWWLLLAIPVLAAYRVWYFRRAAR